MRNNAFIHFHFSCNIAVEESSTSASPRPPSFAVLDSKTMSSDLNSSPDGRVVQEGTFQCLSKGRGPYRLVLTPSHLFLHNAKDPSKMERYCVEDIFGCHTLRHKKQGGSYSAAYICFYLYPRSKKKGMLSTVKYREKVTLVFEVKQEGNSYEKNLEIATLWKNGLLGILAAKYPKWQLHKSQDEDKPNNNSEDLDISRVKSQDVMDQGIRPGEPLLPLVSYLSFTRRFLVILNPKSGQGKTRDIFEV